MLSMVLPISIFPFYSATQTPDTHTDTDTPTHNPPKQRRKRPSPSTHQSSSAAQHGAPPRKSRHDGNDALFATTLSLWSRKTNRSSMCQRQDSLRTMPTASATEETNRCNPCRARNAITMHVIPSQSTHPAISPSMPPTRQERRGPESRRREK